MELFKEENVDIKKR